MLARGVDRDVGDAGDSGTRGRVYDGAAAVSQHVRNLVLQAEPDTLEIHANDAVEFRLLQLVHRPEFSLYASIVDCYMNTAEALGRPLHNRLYLALASDVRLYEHRVDALPARLGLNVLPLGGAQTNNENVRSRSSETQGGGAP